MKRGTAEKRFRAVYQTHTRNNLPPLSSDSRNTNDSISFDFFSSTWVKESRLICCSTWNQSRRENFGSGVFLLK